MVEVTQALEAEIERRARSLCKHLGVDPDLILDDYGPVHAWDIAAVGMAEIASMAIAEGRRQMREEAAKLLEDANAKWQERVAVYRKAGNNGPYLGYGSVSAAAICAIPIGDE